MTDPFPQLVAAALAERFRAMGLECAGRADDPRRWSRDDLATDLAPCVAAAIHAAVGASVGAHAALVQKSEDVGLAALRGTPDP